jgi:hypothetical protein
VEGARHDLCLLITVCQTLSVLRRRLTRFDDTKMNRKCSI